MTGDVGEKDFSGVLAAGWRLRVGWNQKNGGEEVEPVSRVSC